jgi:hypothetical protein
MVEVELADPNLHSSSYKIPGSGLFPQNKMEEFAAWSNSWLNIFSCILPVLRLELISALIGTPLVVHTQIIQYFLEKSLHISKDVSYLIVNSSIQMCTLSSVP